MHRERWIDPGKETLDPTLRIEGIGPVLNRSGSVAYINKLAPIYIFSEFVIDFDDENDEDSRVYLSFNKPVQLFWILRSGSGLADKCASEPMRTGHLDLEKKWHGLAVLDFEDLPAIL
ncbi:hypothetical protein MTR_5g063855 [Medicago truncatula]|uniref:Uncharacterized protein n=1 Tax=Medicago truncatula TaxID=3880 RepID=A0A072UEH5_MEDTR|nr:hypothetical protein MTR_5g063855 [Medicago truncatula]